MLLRAYLYNHQIAEARKLQIVATSTAYGNGLQPEANLLALCCCQMCLTRPMGTSAASAAAAAAAQAGTVTFSGQVVYSSYEQWLADVDKHCVAPDTPYSWQPGG
jgi:hypothetical protein